MAELTGWELSETGLWTSRKPNRVVLTGFSKETD